MGSRTRVVIINVDTVTYTALAAASARQTMPFDITLIDCSRAEAQAQATANLAAQLDLDYRRWPLKTHGQTLDRLFGNTEADRLILLDSDAEILDGRPMLHALQADPGGHEYGIAWEQPTARATEAGSPISLYMARPWIPFCAFTVHQVRELITDGASFEARRVDNDLLWLPARLRRLISLRRHVPILRTLDLDRFQSHQQTIDGETTPYFEFDTGAALHRTARARGLSLRRLSWDIHEATVFHVHGGTRSKLHFWMRNHGARSEHQVRAFHRLRSTYRSLVAPSLLQDLDRAENIDNTR